MLLALAVGIWSVHPLWPSMGGPSSDDGLALSFELPLFERPLESSVMVVTSAGSATDGGSEIRLLRKSA